MTPNFVQTLYEQESPNFLECRGIRDIILKARQMGITTRISARYFEDTINVANTQSMIIAQDEVNSQRIFQMIRRYNDNLPPNKQRKLSTDSKNELWWKDIDSYFYVGWAGSKRLGRGGTLNNLHCSEVAFWENAGELIGGLFQSIPDDGNVSLESTANGVGGYFYDEYQGALEGDSLYTPYFYPWFKDPSYRATKLNLTSETEFIISEEEKTLISLYGLDDEQLIWRRNKVLELKRARKEDDKVGLFPQEYPSTAEEAFLTTGVSFFDQDALLHKILPFVTAPLANPTIPARFPDLQIVNRRDAGKLTIWHLPETNHRYIVSGDPAEGLKEKGSEHDFCVADVVDVETWEQVAQLRGKWEPAEFAELINQLGRWYHIALVNVARMNHGHAVLNNMIVQLNYPSMMLARKEYGWGGIYYHSDYDDRNRKKLTTKKPGYPENQKTKMVMLGTLSSMISDQSLKINSTQTIKECRNYAKLPGGQLGATTGHDDCVTSLALVTVLLRDATVSHVMTKRRKPIGRITSKSGNNGVMM